MIALDDFEFKKEIICPMVPDNPVTGPPPVELWSCNFSSDRCDLDVTGEGDWYRYVYTNTTQHNDGNFMKFLGILVELCQYYNRVIAKYHVISSF